MLSDFSKTLFFSFFFFFFSISLFASTSEENKKVILYIDVFGVEDHKFARNLQIEEYEIFKKEMQNLYPDRPIRSVFADNLSDLKEKLDSILYGEEKISHLYWTGHGVSFLSESKKYETVQLNVGKEYLFLTYPKHEKVESFMNEDSINVLSGIHKRFTEDSIFFSNSCKIVDKDPKTAIQRAKAVQAVFGQQNGLFYGNSHYGLGAIKLMKRKGLPRTVLVSSISLMFASIAIGFYYSPHPEQFTKSLIAVLAPVVIPLLGTALVVKKLFTNKGYAFIIKNGEITQATKISFVKIKRKILTRKCGDLLVEEKS